jgi:hypothetical protein
MAGDSVKVTFLVSTDAKFRLESLKSRLRREGIDATESGLVELLLSASSLSALEAELRHS